MRIAAVILNFRRADETIQCVRSLQADSPGMETIVVDNGSADGSAERIARDLTDILLIRNASNDGYAGGNNIGIGKALAGGADAILVLNNDLTLERGCIEGLTRALTDNDWGVAGPLSLLGDSDLVDFFGGRVMLEHGALVVPGRDEPRAGRFTQDKTTEYVTGSAMLIRRTVLERVGLFDERFFLVWEDVDLSLRASAAGYTLGATPHAIVRHQRSISFGGEQSPLQRYFFVRNPYLLIRKHLAPPARWLAEARISRRYRRWAKEPGAEPQVSRAIARGMRDGVRGRFGPPPSFLRP